MSAPTFQDPARARRRKARAPQKTVQARGYSLDVPRDFAPLFPCRLRLLKQRRMTDFLQIEREFISGLSGTSFYKQSAKESQEILSRLRGGAQSVGQIEEVLDQDYVVVSRGLGANIYTRCLSIVDRDLIRPNASVYLHDDAHRDVVVGVLVSDEDPTVASMKLSEKPQDSYADVGGLEEAIQELRETIQLPLTNPEYFTDLGIEPPRSCILFGPSGTGKSLLARACAHETSATFLRMTGSELIQKYSGEGPRLVRELFRTARACAPSIVFIDEVDTVGGKRYAAESGGEREIQRTLLELLNQLDGFDRSEQVKCIMATNLVESLDSALIRAGRVDRKIYVGLPDAAGRKKIFEIHSRKMCLDADVKPDEILACKEDLSGADIKAICLEAGLLALRERRMRVGMDDFRKARDKVLFKRVEDMGDLFS